MSKFLKSSATRTLIIAYALLAASFFAVVQALPASAQAGRTELVLGLQNDMTTLNFWNPETNTVWNFYQVGWSFETLFSSDPDFNLYPVLADPARTGPNPGPEDAPGYDIRLDLDPSGLTIDVFIRQGITFHDGQTLDADDVVFSFQTKAWSTESTVINSGLWNATARFPHWSGTGQSHIGVERVDPYTVRFTLARPYALFFFGTLGGTTIIPRHIWENHIDPAAPTDFLDPTKKVTSADRSIDLGYGDQGQLDSTVGTGMFKLESWTRQSGSRIVAYDGYWGKTVSHTWRGTAYPFFPENIRSIKFVIFSSLDVISLALQRGEIDSLIWSLTPGFLSQVRTNPAISVEQVTDRGYFYLAFNLRRKPWNDLDLRKAISMAIDKDYIVNTLMGGFGIKGAQPISIHNPAYVNASALPPSFDLTGAQTLLDNAQIIDRDGDGFREYKDGTPIKTTILTPPKDYDPVRADAGIMISNNLKRIGLNIDAAPTSFDTIVSKAFTEVDFDIYILGWLLGDFPELYLCDFFCTRNDVAINPAGSNSAGYSNPVVDALLAQADVTLDNAKRIQLLKDVQGIVVQDLPWNVLYYRKNLNAYRNDRWVGWVNTPPQIYNFWSISKLRPAGVGVVPPTTGALSVAMRIPQRVLAGSSVPIDVFVSQNLRPVSDAAVQVTAPAVGLSMSGTTTAGGRAQFTWQVPAGVSGSVQVNATATSGSVTGQAAKVIEIVVGPPAPVASLSLSTATPVIVPGQTATINADLIDSSGAAIPGVSVTVDTTLVLGTVTPTSGVTNANGRAVFTYTAPMDASKFPNQHLSEVIRASVDVAGTIAKDTQTASLIVFVENPNAPAWFLADVQGTPSLVLNLSLPAPSTSVDVLVTNYAGTPQQGVDVEAVLPEGDFNVTVTPSTAGSNKTDASGIASFDVRPTAGALADRNVTNVPIRFRVAREAFQVSDEIAVLLTDGTTPGYAALLDFSSRALVSAPTPDVSTVTATVQNQLGLPAQGAAVIFQITYADLGLPAQFRWAYDYGGPQYLGEGLDLNFFGLGSLGPSFESSAGQGTAWGVENFVEDFEVVGNIGALTGVYIDSCDPTGQTWGTDPWPDDFDGTYIINSTGITDAPGTVSATFTALPHKVDSPVQIRAYIGNTTADWQLHVAADACSFVASVENANFVIDSGVVIERAPVFALGSVVTDTSILTSEDRTARVTATFYDRNGPVDSAEVFLTRGAGAAARNVLGGFGGTIKADATGNLTRDVTVPLASLSQPISFSFIPADARYAYGGREQLFSGNGANWGDWFFAPTFAVLIAKIPFDWTRGYYFVPSKTPIVEVDVDQALIGEGGTATATVTVKTATGTPIGDAVVWSGPYQAATDSNGVATFTFASPLGATEGLVVATAPTGEIGRAWYGIMSSKPVLTYGAISVTEAAAGSASTISLSVTNSLTVAGTETVMLLVDGEVAAAQTLSFAASETKTVTFEHVFANPGEYQVTVGTQSTSVTIPAAPVDTLATIGLPIALLVVGVVVGVVVGMMLGRRGKKPPAVPAEQEPGTEL